ncbi:MAG: hybrid sensor histidine kinase/response regulator [Bacteroidota bacterium]|nr:hybrid sensor histidine kinase/response regulator [Bacteroidota bacterium]MDP3145908.1 hybrid sensor histidine kinase/response regulator [Bacteroidota bacterium]MDP3558543.1 hybrid sensor histidine kinase/response regulator [Bacteroidota bacterium]
MITEKIKILYVDDEENNLVAFRSHFRKDYEVHTAISAEVAFSILEIFPIFIIISDERMPDISGVEFLEKVKDLYPDSVRLLITGYSDINVVIDAINRGQISKFIQKPWDWDKLSIAIDHCVTIYNSRLEIKLKNGELTKANEELNKFVYSVSHDLRSPLTSILGVINVTKLMPELRVADSYFDMIEGRVIKLDTFIKNIIDYHKNARLEVATSRIDLQSFILEIWDSLKDPSKLINFELIVNQEKEFFGDKHRLAVVFKNLISNAIKYQNPSVGNQQIKLSVKADKDNLHILIEDNGIGIDKKHLENIFQLFFRTENSLNIEGTGIGLYMVKESVEKMGGNIKVSSSLLIGTTFELLIPNKFVVSE